MPYGQATAMARLDARPRPVLVRAARVRDELRPTTSSTGLGRRSISSQYAQLFVDNEVDLATLRVLTDDDLKELGLPFGPRKRLLAAVAAGSTWPTR